MAVMTPVYSSYDPYSDDLCVWHLLAMIITLVAYGRLYPISASLQYIVPLKDLVHGCTAVIDYLTEIDYRPYCMYTLSHVIIMYAVVTSPE